MLRLQSALLLVSFGFGCGTCIAQKNQPDLVERVRQAIAPALPEQSQLEQFTYFEAIHDEARDASGVRYFDRRYLFEITHIEGKSYRRLVELDGKPLKGKAAKQEQSRYETALKGHSGFGLVGHAEPDDRGKKTEFRIPISQLPTRFQLRVIRHGTVEETSAGSSAEVIDALPYVSADPKVPGPTQRLTLWIAGDTPELHRFQFQLLRDEGELLAGSEGICELTVVDGALLVKHTLDHLRYQQKGVRFDMTSDRTYTRYRRFSVKSRLIEPDAQAPDPSK